MSIGGWRWVYYFNSIFYGLSGLLIMIFYDPPPTLLRRVNSIGSEIRSVDYLGLLFLLCGVAGIVTSLTWGGNAYPWASAHVLAMLVIGLAFFFAFCFYG